MEHVDVDVSRHVLVAVRVDRRIGERVRVRLEERSRFEDMPRCEDIRRPRSTPVTVLCYSAVVVSG